MYWLIVSIIYIPVIILLVKAFIAYYKPFNMFKTADMDSTTKNLTELEQQMIFNIAENDYIN